MCKKSARSKIDLTMQQFRLDAGRSCLDKREGTCCAAGTVRKCDDRREPELLYDLCWQGDMPAAAEKGMDLNMAAPDFGS